MAELANQFSFSKSRDGKFRECLRAYWFHYYGSWGGWNARADVRTHELYTLKNLRSRWMWAGDVVHRCIERVLTNLRRDIPPLEPAAAVEATLASMRDEWRRSRDGALKERLYEHAYAIDLPDARWKETADHVRHCLETFYASPELALLRTLPKDRWLEVEELASFQLGGVEGAGPEGIKIFVKLDVAYRTQAGGVAILDWKTGRRSDDDHSMQVATYVLYAGERWGTPPPEVETTLVHLAFGRSEKIPLGPRALEACVARMRTSLRDMLEKIDDPVHNRAIESDYPPVDDPRICRSCNFRRVCEREGAIRPMDPAPPSRL